MVEARIVTVPIAKELTNVPFCRKDQLCRIHSGICHSL